LRYVGECFVEVYLVLTHIISVPRHFLTSVFPKFLSSCAREVNIEFKSYKRLRMMDDEVQKKEDQRTFEEKRKELEKKDAEKMQKNSLKRGRRGRES
jgi:hypothetical protein